MMSFSQFAQADEPLLFEADEMLQNVRPRVLASMSRVQQLHRQLSADRTVTKAQKATSAELVYVTALIGALIDTVLRDSSIVQRSISYRP
jgi:hypothetical protein